MERYIQYLLNHACPSIIFRTKREILGDLEQCEKQELEKKIMEDQLVKKYLDLIQCDGWINKDFHSEEGAETALRVFTEKGLSGNHPIVAKMLKQFEERKKTFDQGCMENVGKILDALHLGGSQLIRAVVFAYAGMEEKDFVKEQIELALEVFQEAATVVSFNRITREYKGKLVFQEEVKWPSIYHLRLLAYTYSWRTETNNLLIQTAIQQMIDLSPIPSINALYKSQVIAPASFAMHHFKVDFEVFEPKDWMMWFHRMELLSRIGLVESVSELKRQLDVLIEMLHNNNGIFAKRHSHRYFTRWSPYTGMALEKDWRTKERYLCDLYFRSLLIIQYAESEEYSHNY
ncbi:hypothetical protein GOQ29_01980 [Clostridium sp. D2Q-14]|uniref:hypothetical protein n=1 Tax=Anaeromonas gelatinilytica TaxID=2683194 RepID=UPI00193AF52D|nr:hypothetical protein [Anaeromonas gelatinilytica]MBS4534382.1 hypothetical protein [Anaeromonas gelatinilytica]